MCVCLLESSSSYCVLSMPVFLLGVILLVSKCLHVGEAGGCVCVLKTSVMLWEEVGGRLIGYKISNNKRILEENRRIIT